MQRKYKSKSKKSFRKGDNVIWNSEAGMVSGKIIRKLTKPYNFKGYIHHASKTIPQYLIKSNKSDHVAIHKGLSLRKSSRKYKNKHKSKHRFGDRNLYPRVYNAHMSDGMLLANDSFAWMQNPLERALNSG